MHWTTALAAAGVLAIVSPVWAQSNAAPRPWSVEIHGGLLVGQTPGGGVGVAEFAEGPPLLTDGAPTRVVPSWYFGDGTRLFNQVNASFASQFGVQLPRLIELDPVLRSAAARRRGGGSFGVRVTRRLTPRVDLEFGFGVSQGRFDLTGDAEAAIEAVRASFETAFTAFFTTLMPQTNLRVTSEVQTEENQVHQMLVSGGVIVHLTPRGRVGTYVSAGVGRVANGGSTAQVRLRGNYQFRFLGQFPYNESDAVTISFRDRDSAVAGLFGGGVTYGFGARHGIRGDARVQMSASRITTSVDAVVTRVNGTPGLSLPSASNPSIQFSNIGAINSSLSGRLSELTTFTGDGVDTRVLVTVGYFVRF
jgi:hypothetical protein